MSYVYKEPLSLDVKVKNNDVVDMYICGLEDTPLIGSLGIIFGPKPKQHRCVKLPPGTETILLRRVSFDSPIAVTAGGYPVLLAGAAGVDAATKGIADAANALANWAGSMIRLDDTQHKLVLVIRSKDGRILGLVNKTLRKDIHGALYIDQLNGTLFVYLPPDINSYDIVIDASYALHKEENYTLRITTKSNNTFSSIVLKGAIVKGQRQIGEVDVNSDKGLLFKPRNVKIISIKTSGKAKVTKSVPSDTVTKTAETKTSPTTLSTQSSTTRILSHTSILAQTPVMISALLALVILVPVLALRKRKAR